MNTAAPMPAPSDAAEGNPWRDLKHYEEAQAALFFARDREIEQLDRLLTHERLVVLYGVSGLGKTSLLLAGVFPRLRERNCFPLRWRPGLEDPGRRFTPALLQALHSDGLTRGYEVPEMQPEDSLWQYFHRRGSRIWNAAVRPQTPVIVLDQFEEIFVTHHWTPAQTESELTRFFKELGDLVENRSPAMPPEERQGYDFDPVPVHVVLTIREDFVAPLEALRGYFPTLRRAEQRLLRFVKRQALEVICGRDGQLEQYTTPEARDAILERVLSTEKGDTAAGDGSGTFNPAILSLFLHRLYRGKDEPRISETLVRKMGQRILSDFYDEALASVPRAEQRQVARFIEEELVAGTSKLFRDRAPVSKALERGVSLQSLKALGTARLLVSEGTLEDETTLVELTHDCLSVIAGERRNTRRLKEAGLEIAKKAGRWVRVLVIGLCLVLFLLALLAAGVAGFQWWKASSALQELSARNRELMHSQAAEKLTQARDDLKAAGEELAAIKKGGFTDPEATEQELLDVRVQLDKVGARLKAVGSTPDLSKETHDELGTAREQLEFIKGSLAAIEIEVRRSAEAQPTVSQKPPEGVQAEVRTIEAGQSAELAHEGAVTWLAFSPLREPQTERFAVTSSVDKTVRLWDLSAESPKLLTRRAGSSDAVNMVSISSDADFVAAASNGSTVRLYNLRENRADALERQTDSISSIQFRPARPAGGYEPHRHYLASASADRTVYVYRTGDLTVAYHTLPRLTSIPTSVVFSNGARELLVSAADDGLVRLHDWTKPEDKNNSRTRQLRGLNAPAKRATFSGDDRWVVSCSGAGEVAVWSTEAENAVRMLAVRQGGKITPVFHAIFSPRPLEERYRVVAGSGDGLVRLWDFQNDATAAEFSAHTAPVRFLAWSSDGKWLASGDSAGAAMVWAFEAGKLRPVVRLAGHSKVIRQVVFSPDNTLLATCSDDGTARLWPAKLWVSATGPQL